MTEACACLSTSSGLWRQVVSKKLVFAQPGAATFLAQWRKKLARQTRQIHPATHASEESDFSGAVDFVRTSDGISSESRNAQLELTWWNGRNGSFKTNLVVGILHWFQFRARKVHEMKDDKGGPI